MNQQTKIRLGISTCPNDTFAFAALMEKRVDWRGLDFDVELLDIQQLNDQLFANRFDVAKASFHAALLLADSTVVMPSGSALGFGVGPLLLAAQPQTRPDTCSGATLCPGQHTTATLLFSLFYPESVRPPGSTVSQCVFSEIMPRLKRQQADFGVCIHEGRFTWQAEGLHLVEDLGTRWESETDCPLPLGGILGSRILGDDVLATVQAVIHDSLRMAIADPDSAKPAMRRSAQEFDDGVLMQHVDLYVNQWTVDLGDVGRTSLAKLSQMAASIGLIDDDTRPIQVWSPAGR